MLNDVEPVEICVSLVCWTKALKLKLSYNKEKAIISILNENTEDKQGDGTIIWTAT